MHKQLSKYNKINNNFKNLETMKKFYMTIVALLCSFAAMAQDTEVKENIIYVPDISVPAGETTEVTVSVCMKNADPIRNTQVNFPADDELPAGITYLYDDEDELVITRNADRLDLDEARAAEKKPTMSVAKCFPFNWQGQALLFGSSKAGYWADDAKTEWKSVCFLGNDGEIYSFGLVIDASVAANVYKIPFTYALVEPVKPGQIANNIATTESFEVVINVGGTGIHSINAADSNAPIYNVAGQRVSKAQKGVFIQNGKKIAVK